MSQSHGLHIPEVCAKVFLKLSILFTKFLDLYPSLFCLHYGHASKRSSKTDFGLGTVPNQPVFFRGPPEGDSTDVVANA